VVAVKRPATNRVFIRCLLYLDSLRDSESVSLM